MRSTCLVLLFLVGCGESPAPDGGAGAIGAACEGSDGCAAGLACLSDARFPDGYCTVLCPDGACPAGASCEPAISPAVCLAGCAGSDECREGYQCWRGACRLACASDGDCAPGTCGADGQCVDAIEADGGMDRLPIFAPCTSDAACMSGICLPAALGGVCTIACTDSQRCFDEGELACSAVVRGGEVRTICTPLPAAPRPMGAPCTADDHCEARVCHEGQCTEVCDDDLDCRPGQICTELPRAPGTYRGCGYTPRAGAIAIEEIDLGERVLGAATGGRLEIATPPDAVSLTLQARRTTGDPLPLSFVEVTDPSGRVLFDVREVYALADPLERWLPLDTGESITMTIPNSTPDRFAFVPGSHRWSVGAIAESGSASVRLSAIIKRAAGRTVSSGTLDLNVHLVGVGVTAAQAPGHARLQTALSRLETILSREAAIALGDIDYFDVTGADATRYSVIDSTEGEDSELAGLFRLSAPRAGRRLNIYVVRSIDSSAGGFQSIGVAGGIPGPVGMHGTQHSGVVTAFDSGVVSAEMVGHVLAHEIGHYLGLFHATERIRPCGDDETPDDGCLPFGAGDTLADTPRGDMANLMYWSIVGSGSNQDLSAGQAFVIRLNPLVGP